MHDCIVHNDDWLYLGAHCRDSGVILLVSGGAGMELLQIWGHWAQGESLGHRQTPSVLCICTQLSLNIYKQHSFFDCANQHRYL